MMIKTLEVDVDQTGFWYYTIRLSDVVVARMYGFESEESARKHALEKEIHPLSIKYHYDEVGGQEGWVWTLLCGHIPIDSRGFFYTVEDAENDASKIDLMVRWANTL